MCVALRAGDVLNARVKVRCSVVRDFSTTLSGVPSLHLLWLWFPRYGAIERALAFVTFETVWCARIERLSRTLGGDGTKRSKIGIRDGAA